MAAKGQRAQNFKDRSGQRFGSLIALEPRKDKHGLWRKYLCKCDCGKITCVHTNHLLSGRSQSCGCMMNVGRNPHETFEMVEGTNLTKIASHKPISFSTTGVRGVSRLKNGKFRATIQLRKKQYKLGDYDTIEEAAVARAAGEEKYYAPILEAHGKIK